MIPGETILTGAPLVCPDCRRPVTQLQVLQSAAGWYIGSLCGCGPYTRESPYYQDYQSAARDLAQGEWIPR